MRTKLCMGLLVFAGVLALGACSRQHEAADAVSEPGAGETAPAAPMPAEERSRAGTAAGVATTADGESQAPDPQLQLQSSATTQVDGERKFIRTADVRFRVREVYRSALAIEDLVAEHGGFVAKNDIRTEINDVDSRPSGDGNLVELATYTVHGALQVRVPSERTQPFLRALASQIEFLDGRNFAAVDAQFEMLRQQLAQARHQQAQRALGDVADGRAKPGEKTEAITARTESQSQRDEALIAQKSFEDRVAFATIDLSLYQLPQVRRTERPDVEAIVRRDAPGFFPRLGHSLAVGWYGVLDVVVALARLWPLWLVLAGTGWLARRWRRGTRKPA